MHFPHRLLLLLLSAACLPAALPVVSGRQLRVDPRDPAAFATLKAAAAQALPGDTLWLAPQSGPYREELYLSKSGTEEAPIRVEGNDNEITGYDPLVFTTGPDGRLGADVAVPYPFALRHQGTRIPEDAVTRRFSSGISYDSLNRRLILDDATSPEGWEISVRAFAVRIAGVSHQNYRNLVASGSRNDGFNLHGTGSHLLFENITGRDNFDEGFSSHDHIESEIRGGRFFGNDNGMVNIGNSSTRLSDIRIWHNLGIGFELHDQAVVDATRLRVWDNGMRQFALIGAPVFGGVDVIIYRNQNTSRPWLTYMESAKQAQPPVTLVGDAARALAAASILTLSDTPGPAENQAMP
ncbi:MAG: right-handed parallel beta-helix repeat-containing protein [Opitutaceae bacterium]|jgi:hypothetical protein